MQGQKRAVLIGCNYPGTDAALKGCVNDVIGMNDILRNVYGFSQQNIKILVDTDDRYVKPEGATVKKEIAEAIHLSRPGDVLIVHYSGHGTQVPTPPNPGNPNGKAQAIVPCDMNLILDDDLVDLFENVREGVTFTLVADCCHSGTLLNQQSVIISGTGSGGRDFGGATRDFVPQGGYGGGSRGYDGGQGGGYDGGSRGYDGEQGGGYGGGNRGYGGGDEYGQTRGYGDDEGYGRGRGGRYGGGAGYEEEAYGGSTGYGGGGGRRNQTQEGYSYGGEEPYRNKTQEGYSYGGQDEYGSGNDSKYPEVMGGGGRGGGGGGTKYPDTFTPGHTRRDDDDDDYGRSNRRDDDDDDDDCHKHHHGRQHRHKEEQEYGSGGGGGYESGGGYGATGGGGYGAGGGYGSTGYGQTQNSGGYGQTAYSGGGAQQAGYAGGQADAGSYNQWFAADQFRDGFEVGRPGVKNRGISDAQFGGMFNQMYGSKLGYEVDTRGDPMSLHRGLRDAFGPDASGRAVKFLNIASTGLNMAAKYGILNQQQAAIGGKIVNFFQGQLGGGGGGGGGGGQSYGDEPTFQQQGQGQQQQSYGAKPANQYKGRGVLITGCTSTETSADACPSGDPNKAYGALSNALQSSIKDHLQRYGPNQPPITSRDLVTQVRQALQNTGFKQHPCLEGYPQDVDRSFVLG